MVVVKIKVKNIQSIKSPPYRGGGHFGHLGRKQKSPLIMFLDILDTYTFIHKPT